MSGGARPVVIGAGWSGLACAVDLVRGGQKPLVLDMAPHAGGRARCVEHEFSGAQPRTAHLRLDNGQHLLLGAYRDSIAVMRFVGVDTDRAFRDLAFEIAYPDAWRLAAAELPAPFHLALGLVGASGITVCERVALLAWAQRQRLRGWRAGGACAASELFAGHPPSMVLRLWRPLCLAALNVELNEASAQIYLNVLRDSLGAGAHASRLLLPRADLSQLFPDAAVAWLRAHGAEVRLQTQVAGLRPNGDAWRLLLREADVAASHVALAIAPDRAAELLEGAGAQAVSAAAQLRAIRFAPISTVYLRYEATRPLRRPFYALIDDAARLRFGQWVFDRGALDPALCGVLAVVISGAGRHAELPRAELARHVADQLAETFGLPPPRAQFVITEKHATIVPAPSLRRPSLHAAGRGLYLAGDCADSPYPSTIEASVRSGREAARAILQDQPQAQIA